MATGDANHNEFESEEQIHERRPLQYRVGECNIVPGTNMSNGYDVTVKLIPLGCNATEFIERMSDVKGSLRLNDPMEVSTRRRVAPKVSFTRQPRTAEDPLGSVIARFNSGREMTAEQVARKFEAMLEVCGITLPAGVEPAGAAMPDTLTSAVARVTSHNKAAATEVAG